MNFGRFSIFVIVLGALILAFGVVGYVTNLEKSLDPSEARGLEGFGRALSTYDENLIRANRRSGATTAMIIGGIVTFIGIGMKVSAKSKTPREDKTASPK